MRRLLRLTLCYTQHKQATVCRDSGCVPDPKLHLKFRYNSVDFHRAIHPVICKQELGWQCKRVAPPPPPRGCHVRTNNDHDAWYARVWQLRRLSTLSTPFFSRSGCRSSFFSTENRENCIKLFINSFQTA